MSAGLIRIGGGTFRRGAARFSPEEVPARRVRVDACRIDPTPVTNAACAECVTATGDLTEAERGPDPEDSPGVPPEAAVPGALVFQPTGASLTRPLSWWKCVPGACRCHPQSDGSGIESLGDHPVVHVRARDAEAYAAWAGKRLPTEATWERAARGGLDGGEFAWGDERAPEGRRMCNYGQGAFPGQNLLLDGFERPSPVRHFPPNGDGLYDMIGNVWEWTADGYSTAGETGKAPRNACGVPHNPGGGRRDDSIDPSTPGLHIPRRVIKGGSHGGWQRTA